MESSHGEFLGKSAQTVTSFASHLEELLAIKGYKASAILTSDGEVLYNTTPPETQGNFGSWMKVFNNLFDHTCSLSETSGFFACQQVSMRTGEEIVIICSSGQHCLLGLRLLVIIDHHGNEAQIHQKLEQLLPPLMRCLTADPDILALYLKNTMGETDRDMRPMRGKNCDCLAPNDHLHCNKCNHVFCGSCQVVFRNVKNACLTAPPKKSCPNCFSTDLYRKPKTTSFQLDS